MNAREKLQSLHAWSTSIKVAAKLSQLGGLLTKEELEEVQNLSTYVGLSARSNMCFVRSVSYGIAARSILVRSGTAWSIRERPSFWTPRLEEMLSLYEVMRS